jgi:hypothetical protein
MRQVLRAILATVAVGFMVSCGGGGGSAGTSPFGGGGSGGSGGTASTVTSIEVIGSSTNVGTAGETATVTAIARDANNVTVSSAPVAFSVDTGSLSSVQTSTDASGVATAVYSAGSDRTNRTATVSVKSGSVTSTLAITVAGTKLTVSGPTTLQFNGQGTYSVKLVDSKNVAVTGQTVTATSALAATLGAASAPTDGQGTAAFSYTANKAGADTLKFSALGATASVPVTVSGQDFTIISPAASSTVGIGVAQTITARYQVNGSPASGAFKVRFASTAGTFSTAGAAAPGIDIVAGQASASISSSFAGPATVQATLVDASGTVLAQATLPLQFVATTPNAVVVQISPSAVPPNSAGSTGNQATVHATVTDSVGNPVQGAIVNFSKVADPSGGNLSQASATTDSNGQASVQFIAGATPTPSNAVVLSATVAGTSITSSAKMTVNQSALFIALGTGNKITVDPSSQSTRYLKVWTAYVTDASGAAVPNQVLTVSLLPTRYRKGSLEYNGTQWVYGPIVATCANEDTDYSGVVTVAKDVNLDGKLWPGNVISVNGASGQITITTDANGFALLNLTYAESYVPWVEVALKVTATVAGTESSNQSVFFVVGASADFTDAKVPPAGLDSPFGTATSCSNPN